MNEHSNILGGSTAAQRIHCPGSYQLEQSVPKSPGSEFADRGSMLHAVMEMIINTDAQDMKEAVTVVEDHIGNDFGYEGHELTEELVKEKVLPALQSWFDIVDQWDLDTWFVEQRVSLGVVIDGAFGTADILALDDVGRMHIIDWKFGDGVPVPAENNLGLGFYAACALYDEKPQLREIFTDDVSDVVLHIVQPRTGSSDNPHDYWETETDWLEDLVDSAVLAIEKAMQPGAPTSPGSWCRWCDAKTVCPSQQALVGEVISKDPKVMSGVEFADLLRKLVLVEDMKKAAFERALHEMEAGAKIPGWKLVQKRATRRWINEAEAVAACKLKRLKVDDMYDKKLKTPPAMEKRNPKVYSKCLSKLVHSISSGVTVVPDTDKRAAISSSVELLANAIEVKQ